jgi:glycosyltransferase 2 family protein
MSKNSIFRWINWSVLFFGIITIIYYASVQWSKRPPEWPALDGWLIILSGVLAVCYSLLYGIGWHLINRTMNIVVPLWVDVSIWGYSLLGKFTPANIVLFTYRISAYAMRCNAKIAQVAGSLAIESAMSVLSGGILLLLILGIFGMTDFEFGISRLQIAVTVSAMLLLGAIALLPGIKRVILRVLRLQGVVEKVTIAQFAMLLLFYMSAWILICTSFFVLCRAVGASKASWSLAASAYLFAGLSGILAVFAPSGIGIREGVLVGLLSQALPLEQALALAVLSRVNSLFGDVVGISAGVIGVRSGALQGVK